MEIVTCSKAGCKAIFPTLFVSRPQFYLPCTSQHITRKHCQHLILKITQDLAPKALSEVACLPKHLSSSWINNENNVCFPSILSFPYICISSEFLVTIYFGSTNIWHTCPTLLELASWQGWKAFKFSILLQFLFPPLVLVSGLPIHTLQGSGEVLSTADDFTGILWKMGFSDWKKARQIRLFCLCAEHFH